MARISAFTAELGSVATGMECTAATTGANAPTISTTTFRSGSRSMRVSAMGSAAAMGLRTAIAGAAGNGPFFPRVYYRAATLPTAENTIIQLNDTNAFTTPVVRITIDSGGLLRLYDEDAQIGSPSSALSTGVWYRIEIRYDRTPAAGSQVVRAYLDGTEFAGAANRDLSTAVQYLNWGGNLNSEAQTTGDWFFDDIAVNDSTGSFENTLPGEGEEIFLRPNAAGDYTTWERGGTDSGANWSQTDEAPTPNDATDFVRENTTNADPTLSSDDYNIEATPAEMASDDVINVVQVGFRARVDVATGADPDIALRIKASALGTTEESASLDIQNTSWFTNNTNGVEVNYRLTLYDLPGASATAWTKADLDTAQIGIRESVSDTHFAEVTAVWLLVDHKPTAVVADELLTGRRMISVP